MLRGMTYLVAGALLAMWIDPPPGIMRYGLIVAIIVGAAFLDAQFRGRRRGGAVSAKVVSLFGRRSGAAQSSKQSGTRESRGMQLVFASPARSEADELLELLRGEGMRPVLASQNPMDRERSLQFEIRLPRAEAQRAQSTIELFKLRSTKHLN